MTTSTNAELFFGVILEDGFEFPWIDEDGEGDIDDWWLEVTSYKPSVELYDEDRGYLGGVEPSRKAIEAYFAEQRAWVAAHPLPVELVNYQSAECPAYALAVPGTVRTALRGHPEMIEPETLVVDQAKVDALRAFCAEHGIEIEIDNDRELRWFLTSYWG